MNGANGTDKTTRAAPPQDLLRDDPNHALAADMLIAAGLEPVRTILISIFHPMPPRKHLTPIGVGFHMSLEVVMRLIRTFCRRPSHALCACGDSSTQSPPPAPPSNPGKVKSASSSKLPNDPWFQNDGNLPARPPLADGFELRKSASPTAPARLPPSTPSRAGRTRLHRLLPEPKIGQAILDRAARSGMKVMSVDVRLESADGKPLDFPSPTWESPPATSANSSAKPSPPKTKTPLAPTRNRPPASSRTTPPATQSDRTTAKPKPSPPPAFDAAHIYKSRRKTTPPWPRPRRHELRHGQHPEIKNWLIAGVNDGSVVGAVRATEAAPSPPTMSPPSASASTPPSPISPNPNSPGFIATVLISPRRHGYDTSDLMYHWIKDGAEPPKTTWTQGVLIDRANYQQVMKEQGLAQWTQLQDLTTPRANNAAKLLRIWDVAEWHFSMLPLFIFCSSHPQLSLRGKSHRPRPNPSSASASSLRHALLPRLRRLRLSVGPVRRPSAIVAVMVTNHFHAGRDDASPFAMLIGIPAGIAAGAVFWHRQRFPLANSASTPSSPRSPPANRPRDCLHCLPAASRLEV